MNIETVISSLETAADDNRKFALLLILSELIKSKKLEDLKLDLKNPTPEQEETCRALNERLFNSIGSHFLARLITTRQTTENSSPLLYKSVALSIITQFLEYPTLICDPILLSKIDTFCGILILESENSTDKTSVHNLILDTFKYLFTLAKYCPDYLCQNAGILEILMNKIIINKSYESSENEKEKLSNIRSAENNSLVALACRLFLLLACDEDAPIADGTDAKKYFEFKDKKIEQCLRSLLNTTNQDQSAFKFCLINYLNYFMEDSSMQKFFTSESLNEFASDCLFSILNNLFRSKISRAYKQLGLILLSNFVKLYQFEFIYMKSRTFFYFIIHLLCIEISFNLQEEVDDRQVPAEGGLVVFKSLTDTMSVLYTLLEEVIIILSTASPFDNNNEQSDDTGDEASEKDEEPELKKVETLELVITFLKDSLNENVEKMDESDLILRVASIRLLICWLAHESLLEAEIMAIMPELIKFADFIVKSKARLEVNVFEFLVPGIQRVLIDQEDRFSARSESLKKVDAVKAEFLDTELKEKIDQTRALLDQCEIHL